MTWKATAEMDDWEGGIQYFAPQAPDHKKVNIKLSGLRIAEQTSGRILVSLKLASDPSQVQNHLSTTRNTLTKRGRQKFFRIAPRSERYCGKQ
jgi:hypothetical protein